jgi:antitoxin (DNA-binding transcriptional repressor) of toxin-antitoxin stability system
MSNVTIDEILRDPLKYLSQVKAGETFVIIQENQPIAEIRPLKTHTKPQRPYGLCAGEFQVPDDFDAPLPDDILSSFNE